MDLGISDSCVMSVMNSFYQTVGIVYKYVTDVTIFIYSVQSCEYLSFAVFLCTFQPLICVLLNLIQKVEVVLSNKEYVKLYLIRKHGHLVIGNRIL